MKILPHLNIQKISYNSKTNSFDKKVQVASASPENITPRKFMIPFFGKIITPRLPLTEKDLVKAKDYLLFRKGVLKKSEKEYNLLNFNLTRLNGIQKGIEVFENLSMKEIAFVYDQFYNISINRGCSNRCGHCFADAVPQHFKQDSGMISAVSMEDFTLLMNGIKKLNKRLGFNAVKQNEYKTLAIFHDSDCIELEIKDKAGKIFDFSDTTDLLHETVRKKSLFDTSGWPPSNKKQQERAEKFVKYFSQKDNMKKIGQINISLNPFHALNMKSIYHKKAGNEQLAKVFRNLYTDRMANVLYTFTPIIEDPRYSFNARAMGKEAKIFEGCSIDELKVLIKEILVKVEVKYNQDFASERKYIKRQSQIKENISILENKCSDIYKIAGVGRAKTIFDKNSKNVKEHNKLNRKNISLLKKNIRSNPFITGGSRFYRCVDVNGKVYITDFLMAVSTEIQLNFRNKDKGTVPFAELPKNLVITKKMIERDF